MTSRTVKTRSWNQGHLQDRDEEVCTEQVFRIFIDGKQITTLRATPQDLKALGAGFAVTSGRAATVKQVDIDEDRIRVVSAPAAAPQPPAEISLQPGFICSCRQQIVSELWQATGGAHCAVLFRAQEIIGRGEDIGRHNAVDKAVGQAVLKGCDLRACVLVSTGRQPADMLEKVANAGIPAVISKTVPTQQGIIAAQKAGITLIGRIKADSFVVYCGEQRISAS